MERHEVIAVLEILATGVDPGTGGRLAELHGSTVDALSAAGALLKADEASLAARSTLTRNPTFPAAGSPWSEEEDQRLLTEHDRGMTVAQIGLAHGRTSNSITLRLVKLGRIDPATVKVRQRGAQTAAKTH